MTIQNTINTRKIIVICDITLDGVMQSPGGPEEDKSDGFKYGGWIAEYLDEVGGKAMSKQMKPAEYILGRKTFEIFAGYWPNHKEFWPGINDGTKYILSKTLMQSDWKKTVFIQNLEDIKKIKSTKGPNLQVWGSGKLIQLLLKNDLIDELWLKIYPLTLGTGQKLFMEGTIPAAFELLESSVTPAGVIMASYKRVGDVKTGTVGE